MECLSLVLELFAYCSSSIAFYFRQRFILNDTRGRGAQVLQTRIMSEKIIVNVKSEREDSLDGPA